MQWNPESSRRTCLACHSSFFVHPVADRPRECHAISPHRLLIAVQVMPNGGPFLSNLFSLLRPTPIEVTTPPELLPYGWTATDFWAAPLVTGLYATLTHAQPFFSNIHTLLFAFFWPFGLAPLSTKTDGESQGVVAPVDPQTARAVCAIVLCALNVNRALRAYGPGYTAIITQIVNAASITKPLKAPSIVEEEEKSENSPDEDIVEPKRRGRVESSSATSKGESGLRGAWA